MIYYEKVANKTEAKVTHFRRLHIVTERAWSSVRRCQRAFHETDFLGICYLELLWKCAGKIQIYLKSDKNIGQFTQRRTYVSLWPTTQIHLHKIAFFCNHIFILLTVKCSSIPYRKRTVVLQLQKSLREYSIALRHSALLIVLIANTFRSHDGPVNVCGLDDPHGAFAPGH